MPNVEDNATPAPSEGARLLEEWARDMIQVAATSAEAIPAVTDPIPDTCEDCGVTAAHVTRVPVDGSDSSATLLLCSDCSTDCDSCSVLVQEANTAAVGFGRVCTYCFDNACSDCERCGDRVHEDHLDHCPEYGSVCARCYRTGQEEREREEEENEEEEEERDSRVIRPYHSSCFVPIPGAWSAKHGGRLFGIELEVEAIHGDCETHATTIHGAARTVHSAHFGPDRAAYMSLVNMESDGSLSNGFEIISQPLGLDDQRKLWAGILQRDYMRGLKSHNTSTCGLHVHMSRAGITGTQLGRIIVFMNNPENERLIRAIARRYSSDYCKVKYKTLNDTLSTDRYEAVNITGSRTIEFRIFKGSLRRDAVIAAVEFTHAVAEYCADGSGYDMNFSTDSFLHFIQTAPSIIRDTAVLRTYLTSRGIDFPPLPASSL